MDPKQLSEDERVMWETANAQESVPSKYVKDLLYRLRSKAGSKVASVLFKKNERVRVLRGKFKDKTGTVSWDQNPADIGAFVRLDGTTSSIWLTSDDLTLVAKFKVGDRVRVKNYGTCTGKQGMVVALLPSRIVDVHLDGERGPIAIVMEELEPAPAPAFKIGDRVTAVRGSFEGATGVVKQEPFEGTTGVTTGVVLDCHDKLVTRFFPSSLKLVSAPAFKIGDRVRVTIAGPCYGKVGVVASFDNGVADVEFSCPPPSPVWKMRTPVDAGDLELADQLKVGDRVRILRLPLTNVQLVGRYGFVTTIEVDRLVRVELDEPGRRVVLVSRGMVEVVRGAAFKLGQKVRVVNMAQWDSALNGKVGAVCMLAGDFVTVELADGTVLRDVHSIRLEAVSEGPPPLELTLAMSRCDSDVISGLRMDTTFKFDSIVSVGDAVQSPVKMQLRFTNPPEGLCAAMRLDQFWKLRLEPVPPAKPATERLPCPFCGGVAFLQLLTPSTYCVKCASCAVAVVDGDLEKCLAKWNWRTK